MKIETANRRFSNLDRIRELVEPKYKVSLVPCQRCKQETETVDYEEGETVLCPDCLTERID
jgi:hypothetical protein